MRKLLALAILLTLPMPIWAQLEHGFRQHFTEKPFRKDADGNYFHSDAGRTVFLSSTDSSYQVYNAKNELLEQGKYMVTAPDSIGRTGVCTELYSYSKPKAVGNYYRNMPVGDWRQYYPNGRMKAKYTIKSSWLHAYYVGSYDEYYENGNSKVKGNFSMSPNEDSVSKREHIVMPNSGPQWTQFLLKYSDKVGIWYYYNEAGVQEREEEF